jgi:hypothetical protein
LIVSFIPFLKFYLVFLQSCASLLKSELPYSFLQAI